MEIETYEMSNKSFEDKCDIVTEFYDFSHTFELTNVFQLQVEKIIVSF